MSFNYTGNPTALNAPSPVLAPGVLPVGNLPSDGDAFNVSSVAEALKVPLDGVAYLQSVAAQYPPQAYGLAAIGFSPIARTGSGTGTILPSGPVMGGQNIVCAIISSGVVGTATYQFSADGGLTFGTTRTTVSTEQPPLSTVSLNFAGTFVAGDTYQFTIAFTPIARYRDSAGNGRFLVGHNGFDGGRIIRIDETWRSLVSGAVADPVANYPHIRVIRTGTGMTYSMGSFGDTAQTPAFSLGSGGSNASGDSMAMFQSNGVFNAQSGSSTVSELEYEFTPTSLASVIYQHGWTDSTGTFGTSSGIYFQYNAAAGGAIHCIVVQGGTATDVTTNVSQSTGTVLRYRIETHGASTPFGVAVGNTAVVFLINEQIRATIVTNIPAALLRPGMRMVCSAASITATAAMSAYSVRLNRVASSTL